jgi:RNA polymerase sigma-70 factor, ECF subfamily
MLNRSLQTSVDRGTPWGAEFGVLKPDTERVPAPIEIPSPEADALVRDAINGDADAFATLFRVTLPSVYRYLFGRCGDAALAEDLAQDSYMRAMRAVRSSFTGGSSEFVAWLIRIARNRFLDHVKSGRVRWEVVVEETPVTLASGGDPEVEALSTIEGADLKRALEQLTPDQGEVLLMRFFQGLAINEVAAATDRTEGAVKALQFRALRALARILAAEGLLDLEDGQTL